MPDARVPGASCLPLVLVLVPGAGAGAGRWCRALVLVLVLVLVPALWCWVLPAAWRAQFPCTRIGCIPHEVQGHTRTRAGRATYAARAGSQTTGCSRP